MARRNMIETADKVKGTVAAGYELKTTELYELIQLSQEKDIYQALTIAFRYGYILGHRATEAGKYKEN